MCFASRKVTFCCRSIRDLGLDINEDAMKEYRVQALAAETFSPAQRPPPSLILAAGAERCAAAVKPVRDHRRSKSFPIQPDRRRRKKSKRLARWPVISVCRIDTDAGVRGYSFAGAESKGRFPTIQAVLVGQGSI